jgi:hypothetical protein
VVGALVDLSESKFILISYEFDWLIILQSKYLAAGMRFKSIARHKNILITDPVFDCD